MSAIISTPMILIARRVVVGLLLLVGACGPISARQEQAMGLQAWEAILQEQKVSSNTTYKARADRVVARLSQAAGLPNTWQVIVFADDSANAFALPGGKIGIHEGIFPLASDDAQLAAVVGHEMTHVLARHAAHRVGAAQSKEVAVALGGVLLGAAGVPGASTITQVADMGGDLLYTLPFSRDQELEADALGMDLMARAGYDPRAALTFWQHMQKADGGKGPPEFLSTHPADSKRIQALQALLPEKIRIYEQNR